MANFDDGEDPMDDLIESDDYNVIPRPQELIEIQKRLSSSKSKSTSEKSESNTSKKSSDSKSKEKKSSSSKQSKKGSSKVKPLYKSSLAEILGKKYASEKKYNASELDSRFDSFVQSAKTSIHKHKSEATKVSSNESSDLTGHDSKLPDIDIQYSKIMDDPAITPLERFKVLDARDTAMRSRDTKQGDSKKTKIIGTCPDMCPEKERYSRIAKNCLSVLEMTNLFDQNVASRDANHSYMVKEYSRSSADQQQPLPHELRPISVLMFTMDYLIYNIMDLPLEYISLADWYDFIWNRTRSIRKDITQQQLCDVQCVEIIEKCVRFHIHCAEALSEEEAATFDPKINNENLTKCLQTLKHMYHDLQSKGIHCQNEAEFRSYDILLSLTEGETLRLIKDIRKDLLRSSEIKFAFNAALAFKSHNYVKFFKLIEKANYLSSCILHRYIPEARARALQIIVRAYSTPHISSSYPLLSLIKDLKFENLAEASEFCRCYGLEVDDTFINIERKQFSKSASGLTLSRSFLLVGSKMGQSLGKVINKGELPANPLNWYKPHNSFDERNILKFSSLGSVENVGAELPKDNLLPPVTTKSTFIKPLPVACTSSILNLPAEPKGFFSTSSSFVPPVSSSFNFFNKPIDSFTNAPKEQPLFQSQPVFNSTSFNETSGMKKNGTSIGIGSFQTSFNRKTLDLPSTEEFFSFGKKPSVLSEAGYPEVEAENVAMESNNESSNEAVMMEAEEIDEGSMSSMRENIFSCSPQLNFDRKEIQSSRAEESLKELPNSNTSSPHPTALEFSRSEIVYSPITKPSPHPATLEFSRSDIVYSPITKPSIQLEKEFVENEAKEKMSVSELGDSENSSEGIERGVIIINEKERQEQEFNKITEDLVEELCSESIQEYLYPICKEVLDIEKHETAKLKDELEIIRNNLALKTLVKWRFFCERKRHRRKLEKSTLCSPWQAIFLNTPYIRTGAANPVLVYKKHCLLSKLAEERIKKRKEITPGWEEFDAVEIWPLKALRPYPSAYFGNSGFKFFFKLCIVFPSECVSSDISTFMEWICTKFSLHKIQNDKFDAVNTFILHNRRTLISVRAIQLGGDHSRTNYAKVLDGITAMILISPPSLEANEFYEDFTLLLNSDSLQYPYPLYVYFLESQQKVSFHNGKSRFLSFLQEKVDARYFTEFKTECLPEVQNFKQNSNKVSEAVSWFLAEQRKEILHPVLYKCSFVCYIEDSFTSAFNILLCKISLDEFKCLKQMPHHIINFYNKVLKFRSSLLYSDLLERVYSSWPPEEIKLYIGDKFIDFETQMKCQKRMTNLHLPSLEDGALNADNVWDFTKRVAHSATKDQEMLFIRVKNALNSTSDDWLTIINICALHIVHAQKLELSLLNKDYSVYYAKDDVESFDCDEFWREVSSDLRSYSILCSSKRKNDSILVSPVKRKKWEMSKEILTSTQIPLEEKITYISNPFDMPDMLSCQRENLFAPLRAALAKQVEQSEAFSHRLNASVQNVDPPSGTQSEDEFLEENDDISLKMPFVASGTNFYSSSYSPSLGLNAWHNSGVDLLGVSFNDTSKSSFSSLADKISELKYNIQKSNILEDHFSQLLSEQL